MKPTYRSKQQGHGVKDYVVVGVEDRVLLGLTGLTEEQAIECAFHLNLAYESGRREMRDAFRSLLGV